MDVDVRVVDVDVRRQRAGEHAHQARVDGEVHQHRVQVGRAERVDEALLGVGVLGELLDDLADPRDLLGREHAGDVDVAPAVELVEDLARLLGVEALRRRCSPAPSLTAASASRPQRERTSSSRPSTSAGGSDVGELAGDRVTRVAGERQLDRAHPRGRRRRRGDALRRRSRGGPRRRRACSSASTARSARDARAASSLASARASRAAGARLAMGGVDHRARVALGGLEDRADARTDLLGTERAPRGRVGSSRMHHCFAVGASRAERQVRHRHVPRATIGVDSADAKQPAARR